MVCSIIYIWTTFSWNGKSTSAAFSSFQTGGIPHTHTFYKLQLNNLSHGRCAHAENSSRCNTFLPDQHYANKVQNLHTTWKRKDSLQFQCFKHIINKWFTLCLLLKVGENTPAWSTTWHATAAGVATSCPNDLCYFSFELLQFFVCRSSLVVALSTKMQPSIVTQQRCALASLSTGAQYPV